MRVTASNETVLVLIRFKIAGNLRFLSHAETLSVFQRACSRAGIKMQYSQGFNPRPRLSLPLPRSVGIEAEDELLCLRLRDCESEMGLDTEVLKERLSEQLPEGCQLLTVNIAETRPSFQARRATYVLAVKDEYLDDKLKAGVEDLLASETLDIRRRIDAKGNSRNVDVRGFIESIELNKKGIVVECEISSSGSVRVDEILGLLKLSVDKLAEPIRRTRVEWQ